MELTLKDVARFYCCSLSTAKHRVLEIKRFYDLPRRGRILLLHLASYEKLPINDVLAILGYATL